MDAYIPGWFSWRREPYLASFRRGEALFIFTVSMASFTILFIYSTFLPMLPDVLQKKAGIKDDFQLQFWTSGLISVYATAVTIGSTIAGLTSPSHSRPLFFFSLLLFFGGTLMLPLAHSILLILLGRILQGIAASLLRYTAMSLLLYRLDHAFVPVCLKWLTASSHIATNIGPVVGGVLTDAEGLWGGFIAMFVVLAVVGLARFAMLDDHIDKRERGMRGVVSGWWSGRDHQGEDEEDRGAVAKATAEAFGVEGAVDESTPLVKNGEGSASPVASAESSSKVVGYGTVQGEEEEEDEDESVMKQKVTTETRYSVSSSTVLNVVSEVVEAVNAKPADETDATITTTLTTPTANEAIVTSADSNNPLARLPLLLLLLKSPRVWAAMSGIFVQNSILSAFDATLPLFVQRNFSFGLTGSGLALLALSAPGSAVGLPLSTLLTAVATSQGPLKRYIASTSFTLAIGALYGLWYVESFGPDSMRGIVVLCVLLGIVGFSLYLVPGALKSDLMEVVKQLEKENPGVFGKPGGSESPTEGVINWVNHVGMMVGPAVAGIVTLESGWGPMTRTMTMAAAVGAIMTGVWTGSGRVSMAEGRRERVDVIGWNDRGGGGGGGESVEVVAETVGEAEEV